MQMEIKGKGMDIGNALREYIDEHIQAILEKYFGEADDGHIAITKEGSFYKCDIQVHVNKRVMVQAQGQGSDVYACVDEALDHIAKRLRRNKRKLKNHHQQAKEERSAMAAHFVLPSFEAGYDDADTANDDGTAAPMIVAESTTVIETMTVSQAATRMDLLGLTAMLFYNAAHGELNMIHVRHDGHIGWVDPTQNNN
jgi:ribosomal subunit interface protein